MGRMVQYYIDRCNHIVATDIFQNQVDFMNQHFEQYENFHAILFDIMKDDVIDYCGKFDTVLCINVLEHLENDEFAVKQMKEILCIGGNLILFVPAFQRLYCQMDANVNHYRRYDRGVLKTIAQRCDLQVVYNGYFNMMGILPYYIKGRKKMKSGESFSTTLNEGNSKIYNLASKVLEPIEKIVPPKFGLSEIIVLQKK